jgi:hypothetical protein
LQNRHRFLQSHKPACCYHRTNRFCNHRLQFTHLTSCNHLAKQKLSRGLTQAPIRHTFFKCMHTLTRVRNHKKRTMFAIGFVITRLIEILILFSHNHSFFAITKQPCV